MESFYHFDLNRILSFVGTCAPHKVDSLGRNPLHYYANYHCVSALDLILPLNHHDVNQMDVLGQTPLQMAIQNYGTDRQAVHKTVATLLSYKADPNLCKFDQLTPLMVAVLYKDIPLIRLLLSSGANPNQRLLEANPAFVAAGSSAFSLAVQRPLHSSRSWNELDVQIVWLLLQSPITPNTIFHSIQKTDAVSKQIVLKLIDLGNLNS